MNFVNFKGLLVCSVVVLAAGCSTNASKPAGTSGKDAGSATVAECVWPDMPSQAAPCWVLGNPVEGVSKSAVGSHEKTAAGVSFQRDMALADGRNQLAQEMSVSVSQLIKKYAATTGAGASETVDKVNSSVSKQLVSQTLEGSRLLRSTVSPGGTMYVLVGMDSATAEKAVEKAVRSSMKNDAALWQQFKAKQGFDELAEELAKQAASK